MILDHYIAQDDGDQQWYCFEVTDCDTVQIAGPFASAVLAQTVLNEWIEKHPA